jgi:hypothetical protein
MDGMPGFFADAAQAHSCWRRLRSTVACGAPMAGALGYVGLVDPHDQNSIFPGCPFRLLTGWNCPACGGLRLIHDALHGDLAAAIRDNVFLLAGLPTLWAWVLLCHRRQRAALPKAAVATVVSLTLVWTVLRNLPGFPFVPTRLSR